MTKSISYIRPPKSYRTNLAEFNGMSEEIYSTSLPVKLAILQENLAEKNGALVGAMSVKELDIEGIESISNEPYKLFASHYKKGEKDIKPTLILGTATRTLIVKPTELGIAVTTSDRLFPSSSYMDFELESIPYSMFPDNSNNLVSYDGTSFVSHTIGHSFKKICNHNMRAFACKEGSNTLYFSEDFNPYNWNISIDEGGHINLPGENGDITDIISINQSLIVMQESGISKVTAYTDQSEFTVNNINIENDIIANSAVSAIDRIVYCSSMGIGVFDGYESRIFCSEIASKIMDKTVSSAYLDGKCYFNLCDNKVNNSAAQILVIDVATMKYHFITHKSGERLICLRNGIDKAIVTYYGSDEIMSTGKNIIHILTDEVLSNDMIWRSGEIDFGQSGVYKIIKNIIFGGTSSIYFRIKCDGESYSYNVKGERRMLINMRGKEFQFEMKPQGSDIKIPSPIVEFQILSNI